MGLEVVIILDPHVSIDGAVHALLAVGVDEHVAWDLVWSRKFSYVGRWVVQRSFLDHWIAEFEGAEEDVDGS